MTTTFAPNTTTIAQSILDTTHNANNHDHSSIGQTVATIALVIGLVLLSKRLYDCLNKRNSPGFRRPNVFYTNTQDKAVSGMVSFPNSENENFIIDNKSGLRRYFAIGANGTMLIQEEPPGYLMRPATKYEVQLIEQRLQQLKQQKQMPMPAQKQQNVALLLRV